MMIPTIGRIVHYALSAQDVEAIQRDGLKRNPIQAGDVFPAMIVKAWGIPDKPTAGDAVNLQVFLDGPSSYWATSRTQGGTAEGVRKPNPGSWIEPPRVY